MFAAVLRCSHASNVHDIFVHISHMARLIDGLMFTHLRLHYTIADAHIGCSKALQRY